MVVVDRFEGNFAVCEGSDRTMMNIPRSKLPEGVKEGDVLDITDSGITLNQSETTKRRAYIKKLMNGLWK
jgi:hypothetical protein